MTAPRGEAARHSNALALEAADWVVRVHDPDATEADYLAWQRWLDSAAGHQEAFIAAEKAWTLIPMATEPPWPNEKRCHTHSRAIVSMAAALVAAVGIGTWMWWGSRNVIQTKTAEQRSVLLEDGSRVSLAAETRLQYSFDSQRRLIALHGGEAYFEVAHDASRPFVVEVGGERVEAVGTAFNVEAGSHRMVVTVTEGAVRVTRASSLEARAEHRSPEILQLVSGERAAVDETGLHRVTSINNASAGSWRNGHLEYLRAPLQDVIEDLNRYTHRKIELSDPAAGHLEFTGTVFLDHLDEWVAMLPGTLPVSLEDRGGKRILRSLEPK